MKRIIYAVFGCLIFLSACKKQTQAPDTNTPKPADTADKYTGVSKTYEQMGYTLLGRFQSESAISRAYYLHCTEINLVGGHPEIIAMHEWYGKPEATYPIYGKYPYDTFERDAGYTGCYKQFAATSPLYSYEYRITDQGTVYNAYTRANLLVPNTFDFFLCDNKGVTEGKALFSPVKPKVLPVGNDYYAFSVGGSVIALGIPLIVSKLDKVNNVWNTIDTIDYLNGYNTNIDAIEGPSGRIYVCANPMPTNYSTGKLRVYKSNGADWIKSESKPASNMADSIPALGITAACNLRFIANGDQPYIAVMRDNTLSPMVIFFSYDGNNVNIFNPVACSLSDGILPGHLHYIYHDGQILTNSISNSVDYARTIYKVTPYSGFVPYKSIPAAINRKIEHLHSENGKLYIAIKEIWGPEFFGANADRHTEFMDLLIQK